MQEQLESLSVLGDPTRRALYQHVLTSRVEVSRDEAASAAGISRKLAAFHLEKLLESGLLEASYRRLSGRSGPGAGRPAKLYRQSSAGLLVTLRQLGYAPEADDRSVVLRVCPLRQVVDAHGSVVCDVNLALLEQLHARSGDRRLRPVLEPDPGHRCCVLFKAS